MPRAALHGVRALALLHVTLRALIEFFRAAFGAIVRKGSVLVVNNVDLASFPSVFVACDPRAVGRSLGKAAARTAANTTATARRAEAVIVASEVEREHTTRETEAADWNAHMTALEFRVVRAALLDRKHPAVRKRVG